ncbi:type I DNA topoisomerase, partial [Gordonia sp. (in: high G+C Gram-positive bacteria)]|uniref:type I DNA topoisomerase n=1 Tax=Gordonia sp. (in: high G+C Gram-positive bacteria) TaxID=84139 RepID=UPI002FD9034D
MAETSTASPASGKAIRRLVIVESPTKARKIAGYLGPNYVVESSRGHIRDLPRGAADVPARYKGEKWARLGVNVDDNFEPLYVVSPDKKSTVTELKSLLKDVDELYLATDGDREGEAIAWHLLETLKPRIPVKRMVFHEITEPAIRAAADNPRDLDNDLVDAQETRRILDRLYGYEVSPVLWKKVMPKLSAGRVQSVATRIIVDRERERMAFTSADYWDIAATLDAGEDATPQTFSARLVGVDDARVATGRDFDSTGRLKKTDGVVVLDEARARALAAGLQGAALTVASVEEKPYTRKPYAPFMTSTLQQEAGRKLRFTSDRTMRIAQRLYENGYITYMRTDSTTLSESAISAARAQAADLYGAQYVHATPRQYTRKVKNAQEAHEAIRPAGETFRTPGQVAAQLDTDEFRLYELIWQRTVSSQMADAKGTTMSLRISGTAASGETATFAASGRTITFPGFLLAYVETVDEQTGGQADDAESRLPNLVQGQGLTAADLTADGHSTNPPARFTEASLVKVLEELGIGRPSTYASI